MRALRGIGIAIGAALVVTLGIVLLRAVEMPSEQIAVDPLPPAVVDESGFLRRVQEGLRIPTISYTDRQRIDPAAFARLHAHLRSAWPGVHAALSLEHVSGLSLLYRWKGREPGAEAVLLLAHQDVVPVDPGSAGDWTHAPFGGVVADGQLWGRGTLDDKLGLFAILEAVEGLVEDGFVPRGDVYLAFGHDEELGGDEGAVRMAELLKARGVQVGLVLDEGGSVIEGGLLPGLDGRLAVIGIAEKGYLSLRLSVEGRGGHSSAPPRESAIGILAAAVLALERSPFPTRLEGASRAFFERGVGPESDLALRLVYANLWLFSPLVQRAMDAVPGAGGLLRTTTAPTIIRAGVKDNVLPTRAEAVVNFRVLPGETTAGVMERVRRLVADERVVITPTSKRREPSAASEIGSPAYAALARSIREVFPDTVVAPYLMLAGTDARHYRGLCACVYRFLPIVMVQDDLTRAHGTDERVPVDGLADAVRFYRRLIENAGEIAGG